MSKYFKNKISEHDLEQGFNNLDSFKVLETGVEINFDEFNGYLKSVVNDDHFFFLASASFFLIDFWCFCQRENSSVTPLNLWNSEAPFRTDFSTASRISSSLNLGLEARISRLVLLTAVSG